MNNKNNKLGNIFLKIMFFGGLIALIVVAIRVGLSFAGIL